MKDFVVWSGTFIQNDKGNTSQNWLFLVIGAVDKDILRFLMFYQIFFSSKVRRSVNISNKHGIYKLPHKLPNNSRLRILGNLEKLEKSQNFKELKPNVQVYSPQFFFFFNISKNLLRNRNWTFPVVRYFKWKLGFVSNILSIIVISRQKWLSGVALEIPSSSSF